VRADEKMFDRRDVIRKAGERHFKILGANGAGNHVALGEVLASKHGGCRGQDEEVAARSAHVYIVVTGTISQLRVEAKIPLQ